MYYLKLQVPTLEQKCFPDKARRLWRTLVKSHLAIFTKYTNLDYWEMERMNK